MYYLLALQNKYQALKAKVKSLLWNEAGQTMTEYGLLVLLIALALIVVIFAFSGDIAALFNRAGDELTNQAASH
jgi:Flp pilus assembly pilin Flp